ncbi:hypothetical protein RFI_26273, partial [Reticulomyxa filosa]
DSQPLNDKVNDITTKLLAEGITTLQNLNIWINLFNYDIKKNQNQWLNLLTQSLRKWWFSDCFGEKFTGKCYHRKVIWNWESNANCFHFDNKCWDDESCNELKNHVIESLSRQDGSINGWTWLLLLIIKIPSEHDASYWINANVVLNEDKEEENISPNKESKHDPELLRNQLEYCAACVGWKKFLIECQTIAIIDNLWQFIQETLETLDDIIENDKLTFSLCDFLKKDENEVRIRKLGENVIDLSNLNPVMEKFVYYKTLADNFMIVVRSYLKKPPADLEEFYKFCRNLDHYYLSDFETKFKPKFEKEKLLSEIFQSMADREKSELFHIMWNKKQTNPISTINLVDIFKQADSDWNILISKIKNKTLQYIDLEPYQVTNWKLEVDILFPETKHQEKDTIKSYLQDIENASYFLQTRDHLRLLKNATMIIQNIHKNKILKDNEVWQHFDKASIKEASEWYLKCRHYFGDISNKRDVLELICNNEKKIQDLATNEIFTVQSQFEFTIQRMDDSQNEKFRQLVSPLREINQTMKKIIWDIKFESSCELAKAILTLSEQSNNFGIKLAKCLGMDFKGLFQLVKEGDQLSVVKGLGQFEKAGQTGEWVFSDYETMFGHQLNSIPNFSTKIKSKVDKYEGLTLQFGITSLNYDSIENALDRLKLGLDSEGKKKIEEIVLQYEICKEIYAIRIDYWERGGRDKKEKLD